MHRLLVIVTLIGFTLTSFATSSQKEIALTIDDLPFVGSTHNKPGNIRRENKRFTRLIETLNKYKVPATGFVIAGTIESGQAELLEKFKQDGYVVANHTHTHLNLNRTSSSRYINNIQKADERLAPLMTSPKFFRYPYLATGRGERKKQVENYLAESGYIIAPVTVDSKDFRFNAQILNIYWRNRRANLPRIKKRYLNYIWRQTVRAERIAEKKMKRPVKQILLIHSNYLNSHVLGDIIEMYQSKGYKFISLEDALKDPYYNSFSNSETHLE